MRRVAAVVIGTIGLIMLPVTVIDILQKRGVPIDDAAVSWTAKAGSSVFFVMMIALLARYNGRIQASHIIFLSATLLLLVLSHFSNALDPLFTVGWFVIVWWFIRDHEKEAHVRHQRDHSAL